VTDARVAQSARTRLARGQVPTRLARGTRRRRGSGGVTQVRDGVWRVDVEITPDPVTGKRRRISRQVRGDRSEAEFALAKLRVADHEQRLPRPGTKARTVAAALDDYIADLEAGVVELAPKTVVTTRSARNTICSTMLPDGRDFGSIRLSNLGWQEIEALYRVLRQSKSAAWTRRLATALTRALDRARKHGLIEHNPARDATRPKLIRTKPISPTKNDVAALVARVAETDGEIADATLVLACTGVRLGELLGLQWTDVDLEAQVIHVAWAITDGGPGVGILRKATKRSDWRDVPLTAAAVAAFARQQQRCVTTFEISTLPTFYVFPNRTNPAAPSRPDTFGDRFARARGSSPITFLQLRHFTATTMLDAGEDYRTVADLLGNSETTLKLHYDGRTNVDKRRAIAALDW